MILVVMRRVYYVGCSSLVDLEITFAPSIISIEDCINLASIKISERSAIGTIRIKGCSNLKRIIIPENVTSIGGIETDTNDFAICGYENSYAQEFAQNNNIKFEIIGTEEPIKRYTITFQDYDGTVLKEQTVAEGGCGIEPKNLTREGYQFTGWDKELDNITSDRVVVAQYKKENYQEMLDTLPDEIQVDLKESEYEKVGDVIEQKAKEIWKQKGIDTTGIDLYYCDVGMNSREALHTCRIAIQYTIPNMGTQSREKEIKIIYNNSKNYNIADEQSINAKIPAPKYLTIDFSKCDDFDEMDNTVKKYYANSINDSSVEVKLFSGGGDGEKIFGVQYNSGGPYILVFKNDICYYANRIGYIPVVPQIIVPENINDTETDYINYARPLIVQYLKENKADYVKNIENISITKGGTVDWVDFYATNTTKTFNVENGYTVTATTDWGEEKSTIILKKENLNPPTVTQYTVTFKDYDGKVLKTEKVEKGKSATAPTAPTREGYTFKGWDKSFSNITSDVTITAQYEKQSEVKPKPEEPTETRPNINIAPYLFDAKYYADKNSDVKSAFGYNEELLRNHYMTYGIKEGRQASPIFNPQYYINAYGDLKKAFGNNYESAYNHFVNYGYKEGRIASKGTNIVKYIKNVPINITNYMFDAELYYSLYLDLQQAFGYNPEALKQHYLTWGVKEGRIASYVFNPVYYLNNNADVKKVFGAKGYEGAYNHFINNGIHEGRTGSQYFNVTYYLSQYGDLRNAFDINYSKALEHFVTWGMNEGRNASKEFNAGNYKNRYTDLSKAYGNKWKEYYKHYAVYGEAEKRNCK